MVTLEEIKNALLREVGAGLDGLPDELVAAVLDKVEPYIDAYWEMWRWKAYVWPTLQYLYTKRQCLDVLAGQNRDRIQVSVGAATLSQGQVLDNVLKLRDATQKEIERVEKTAQSSRQPSLGTMASMFHMDAYGRLYNPLGWPVPTANRVI